MTWAPIVLFAYNRPWHTIQTLESLSKNHLASDSELIVYVDGPKPSASPEEIKNITKVREFVSRQRWCRKLTVHVAEQNLGLANSVISGVTETLRDFEQLIVIEDDMVFSPYFLQFMNDGLEKYRCTEEVISIHGYCVPIQLSQPVFFLRGADCWGWATWRRGWELFNSDAEYLLNEIRRRELQYNFDLNGNYAYTKMLRYQTEGKVDSWAIRWHASAFLSNRFTLYPSKSLVRNIGGDGSGVHVKDDQLALANVSPHRIALIDLPVEETTEAKQKVGSFYYQTLGLKGKLKRFFKKSSQVIASATKA
jgi:hypothetical protein